MVPPGEQSINIGHNDTNNEGNEAELPVIDNDMSAEYDTADSNASEPESDTEPAQQPVNVPPVQPVQQEPKVSRYGRVIRPRQMYGFDY